MQMKSFLTTPDELPPHDDMAEAGALACVMISPNGEGAALLDQLDGSDFYDIRHREIYTALAFLRKAGKPLDVVALAQRLRDTAKTEDAGGTLYIATLPDQTPSEANFPSFLDTVRDRATRRATVRDAVELAGLALDPRISEKTLVGARRRIGEVLYHPLDHEGVQTQSDDLPPILDAASWIAEPLELPTELVYGLLHRGSKLVLGGGSKTFKTWTLLDLAISVAAGEPWLSCKTAKGRVLYLNFEIPPAFFQRRIQAIATAKGITLAPQSLEVWNLRGKATSYITLLPRIQKRIKDGNYSLIVLDPIYKLYGDTDENSAGAVVSLNTEAEAQDW